MNRWAEAASRSTMPPPPMEATCAVAGVCVCAHLATSSFAFPAQSTVLPAVKPLVFLFLCHYYHKNCGTRASILPRHPRWARCRSVSKDREANSGRRHAHGNADRCVLRAHTQPEMVPVAAFVVVFASKALAAVLVAAWPATTSPPAMQDVLKIAEAGTPAERVAVCGPAHTRARVLSQPA